MKKTFNLAIVALAAVASMSGCLRDRGGNPGDEGFSAQFLYVNPTPNPTISATPVAELSGSAGGTGSVGPTGSTPDLVTITGEGTVYPVAIDPPAAENGASSSDEVAAYGPGLLSVDFSAAIDMDGCQAKAQEAALNGLQLTIVGDGSISEVTPLYCPVSGGGAGGSANEGSSTANDTDLPACGVSETFVHATVLISCTLGGTIQCPPDAACPAPVPTVTPTSIPDPLPTAVPLAD